MRVLYPVQNAFLVSRSGHIKASSNMQNLAQFNAPFFFAPLYPGATAAAMFDRKMLQHHHHHHHHQQQPPQTTVPCLPTYPGYFKEHNEPASVPTPPQHKQPRTTIGHLYPEILTIIFSKLDVRDKGRVAQVCSSWRDAVYAKSCWRGIEAKLHLRKSSSAVFSSLTKRGIKRVHVLSLKKSLREVVCSLPNLESLNLSGTYHINDWALETAFSTNFLQHLKVLNLSLCKQITDDSLKKIVICASNLEVLEMGGCGNITSTGLMMIGWGLKNLKRLNLRSCWRISDQGIAHLAGFTKEVKGNPTLEYLGLQDCQHITDEALRYISEGMSTLRGINLSFCLSITDQGLKHLSRMPQLEELNLSACDNISDMGLAYLTDGVGSLRALDLSFCDKIGDAALGYVAQALFHLRSLNLSACRITDDGLIKVARALHELENLTIGQCVAITDKSVQVFAEELKSLRAIDIYGCTKITSVGLEIIVKLPKLEHLNLGLWHKR